MSSAPPSWVVLAAAQASPGQCLPVVWVLGQVVGDGQGQGGVVTGVWPRHGQARANLVGLSCRAGVQLSGKHL